MCPLEAHNPDSQDGSPRGGMEGFALFLDRSGFSASTKRTYLRNLARYQEWLGDRNKTLGRATWKDVQSYARTLPFTYATRSAFKSALAAFYRSIKATDPPVWAVECPKKPRGQYRGLSGPEDVKKLLDAARRMGPEPYAACCGLYYQGLRREECSRVRWADYDGHYLKGIGKGADEYRMPIHPEFRAAVENLTPNGPWMFAGRWPGTHASPVVIWMWVRLAGAAAGLGRITPHQLRHSSIATINDNAGLRTAAVFARHRDIHQTMIYTRTKEAELKEGMSAL